MSIYDKINAGDYRTKLPYVLRKNDPVANEAYNNDSVRLELQFKADALEECGLKGHPKAEKAYSFAWSCGHAAGYSEVMSYLYEIAEVLAD